MMGLCSRLFILVTLIRLLSACGINPVKSNVPLDLSHPGAIEIVVESENAQLDKHEIAAQTGKNLAAWSYPIASEAKAPVSHRLTSHIGHTEHASTPTGFSLSIGNSDPRALDFQKADVVTISCTLNPIENPAQNAELSMGFSDGAITGSRPDLKALSDHVSTVCFNLLREVKWPVIDSKKSESAGTSLHSGWMPEIRIETETESTATTGQNPPATQPAQILNPSSESEPVNKPEKQSQSVTKEISKEGRKVYIIHNHGNPVIFKFGQDR